MIDFFNEQLKNTINNKYRNNLIFLVISILLFIFFEFSTILLHNYISKFTYIILSTFINSIFLITCYVIIKYINHYIKLRKLFNYNTLFDIKHGTLHKLNTYQITINGLLYEQYELLSTDEQINTKHIIYILSGIDTQGITNKLLKVKIHNNILYAYEVHNA